MCVQSNNKTDWMVIFYYYNISYLTPDSMLIECKATKDALNLKFERDE